jgi:hypothetical protein
MKYYTDTVTKIAKFAAYESWGGTNSAFHTEPGTVGFTDFLSIKYWNSKRLHHLSTYFMRMIRKGKVVPVLN